MDHISHNRSSLDITITVAVHTGAAHWHGSTTCGDHVPEYPSSRSPGSGDCTSLVSYAASTSSGYLLSGKEDENDQIVPFSPCFGKELHVDRGMLDKKWAQRGKYAGTLR